MGALCSCTESSKDRECNKVTHIIDRKYENLTPPVEKPLFVRHIGYLKNLIETQVEAASQDLFRVTTPSFNMSSHEGVDEKTKIQRIMIRCCSYAIITIIMNYKNPNNYSLEDMYEYFNEEKYSLMGYTALSTDVSNFTDLEKSDIFIFLNKLFSRIQLNPEYTVISLIYFEKGIKSDEYILCKATWRRYLLTCILVAAKVWEDKAVWNVDFGKTIAIPVEELNKMEKEFLRTIKYDIEIPPEQYNEYLEGFREIATELKIIFSEITCSKRQYDII